MITTKTNLLLVAVMLLLPVMTAMALEEGGYVGTNDGQGHEQVVANFLNHFGGGDQNFYAIKYQFEGNNNARVDDMDISIFAGHGSPYRIAATDGIVYLDTCGSTAAKGLGDTDCEFLVLVSCECVPSPLDRSDWATPWFNNNSIFDGLHMVCGFRSLSWQSTDQDIAGAFGSKLSSGQQVIEAWLAAIDEEGTSDEKGCIVYYPTCRNDTYTSVAADPPENPTTLNVIYHTN